MNIKHAKDIIAFDLAFLSSAFSLRVKAALEIQFSSFITTKGKPKLLFHFTNDNTPFFPSQGVVQQIGSVKVSEGVSWFKNQEIDMLHFDNEGETHVYVRLIDSENWRSKTRLTNKAFCNHLETQLTRFYYRVFLLFTQLLNLKNKSTFVHAACVAHKGKANLFLADSGVGKSSLLFRMSQENRFSYLADDLCLITNSGEAHYVGRKISTKPYHLKNYPFLEKIVQKEMPFLQKLQWKILNDNRLNYRICPQKLFRGRIAEKVALKKAIHLVNTPEDSFSIIPVSAQKLSSISTNVLSNELFLAFYNLNKVASIPDNTLLSGTEVLITAQKVMLEAFNSIDCYVVTVPYRSHPDRLYDFLEEEGCFD